MTDWQTTDRSAGQTTRRRLLDDPQTAGPLLVAVPADQAAVLLERLHRAGEAAALIGRVTEGPPHLTLV